MLNFIVAAPNSHAMKSTGGTRARSSNSAHYFAVMGPGGSGGLDGAIADEEKADRDCLSVDSGTELQQRGPGSASMLLQHLAAKRGGSMTSDTAGGAAAGSGMGCVGAAAAAVLRSYSNQQTGTSSGSDGEQLDVEVDDTTLSEPVSVAVGPPDAVSATSRAGSAHLARPPPVIMEQLDAALASALDWQFDAFALAEASNGHPLSTLGYYLFHKAGLMEHFNLKPVNLARYLRRIEEGYKSNPYHNATHAADVLQTFSVIINRGGLTPGYVDPLSMLACYSAAVGVPN